MWLFLIILAWAALITVQHIRTRRPFPLDQGFRIFPCKDEGALQLMLGLAERHGLGIKRLINTRAIKRVLLSDGETVFNVIKDPTLIEKMGGRALPGVALVVDDPLRAAWDAIRTFGDYGYSSVVLGELDPDAGPGNLIFVQTDALPGTLLVFRKHIKDMPRPGK